jgi:hypothetical protein
MMDMHSNILLCRFVVFLLMLVIWRLFYENARSIYGMPTGKKKIALRISTTFASVILFALQVWVMQRFSPNDAYGNSFFLLVLVEAGGAIAMFFYVVLKDRATANNR